MLHNQWRGKLHHRWLERMGWLARPPRPGSACCSGYATAALRTTSRAQRLLMFPSCHHEVSALAGIVSCYTDRFDPSSSNRPANRCKGRCCSSSTCRRSGTHCGAGAIVCFAEDKGEAASISALMTTLTGRLGKAGSLQTQSL